MLRKIRIVAALFFFLAVTLLFLGVGWKFNLWFGWMAKVQFLPALLALNVVVLIGLINAKLRYARFALKICLKGETVCPYKSQNPLKT